MKICCRCKKNKELSEFGLDNKQKDKMNLMCFTCRKEYRDKNKEKISIKNREYTIKNKEKKAEYDLKYRKTNKEKIKNHKRNWEIKNKNNPIFKIKRNLRRRINHVIIDGYKSDHTQNLLGCSFIEFKKYLESLFIEGMSWDNYGVGENKWHIDHIRPCCDFDLSKEENQRICFHYKNMQPLWQKDNLKKSYIFNGINCRITKSNLINSSQ